MQIPLTARWSLASDASPAWRRWGDEYVVHHALSNDTHRLSEAAGRLLQLLGTGDSRGIDEMARDSGIGADEVHATLVTLAELGLVMPC